MKKYFGYISAIIVAMMLAFGGAPAQAQVTYNPNVAQITCAQEDSCYVSFVDNGGYGYWMARQSTGTTWVRLTLVFGWTYNEIAPITCQTKGQCVLNYYGGYWMARQWNGTTWVRLTLLNGN